MGVGDKMEHGAEELKGKVKQGVGKATGDESLEAEGHADEAKADLKQVGDELKDAGERAKDALTDRG
ncbi:CsbD family protein [Agromyces soli]